MAAASSSPQLVSLLMKGKGVQALSLLEQGGQNVNEVNDAGKTVLHWACSSVLAGDRTTQYKIVNYLIEHGASIHDETHMDKNNALHYAAMSKSGATVETSAHVVRLLLKSGLVINARNKAGATALHLACEKADRETVVVLLQNGAEIGERKVDLSTPLHSLIAHVPPTVEGTLVATELVEVLVRSGANTEATDTQGRTPRDLTDVYNVPALASAMDRALSAPVSFPPDYSTVSTTADDLPPPYSS